MNFKSTPMFYAGVLFRSRLEADWAATLGNLGIAWEYEPRMVTLPSGEAYLPDFWLPEIGTWIEVKGDGVPRIEKAREWATEVVCKCRDQCTCAWFGGEIVLIGHPALRASDRRFGACHWSDARYSAVFAFCVHCERYSWLRPRFSFRCRQCKVLDPWSLVMSGTCEMEFRHADRLMDFGWPREAS